MEKGSAMNWLHAHRGSRPYRGIWESPGEEGDMFDAPDRDIIFSRQNPDPDPLLSDRGFNSHGVNDGRHVSPWDEGRVDVGVDNLVVRLVQGIDEPALWKFLRRAIRATNGVDPAAPDDDTDPTELLRGGLQTALESQVIVFEVIGASRVLTHQQVRTRRAAFHQQSQRATWYGDRPNARWPMSVLTAERRIESVLYNVREVWEKAQRAAWHAYQVACDAGISYQDARYILPEGTTNYILCEYSIREFIAMFAYRGCSMFQWEMVQTAREMRRVLLEAHPFLEPYVKISCEKGEECATCRGTGKTQDDVPGQAPFYGEECQDCKGIGSNRKCTFQGWENVEGVCSFPWAKQSNRVFLPSPRNRIGLEPAAKGLPAGRAYCPDCTTGIGERYGPPDCGRCSGTGTVCQCLGYGFLTESVPEGYVPDNFDPARTCPTCKGTEISACPTCKSKRRSRLLLYPDGSSRNIRCSDIWHEGSAK